MADSPVLLRRGTWQFLAWRVAFNLPVVLAMLLIAFGVINLGWAAVAVGAANWLGYLEGRVLR